MLLCFAFLFGPHVIEGRDLRTESLQIVSEEAKFGLVQKGWIVLENTDSLHRILVDVSIELRVRGSWSSQKRSLGRRKTPRDLARKNQNRAERIPSPQLAQRIGEPVIINKTGYEPVSGH